LRLRIVRLITPFALACAALAGPASIAAHDEIEVGTYHLVVGWGVEPALVGEPNVIEILVRDHDEKPVVDLGPDGLSVVVSTGGQDSQALVLTPAFDVEEGFGTPGEYSADLIPTAPGDYTFHLTGAIQAQAVDISVTSGDETFSPVQGAGDLEFPVKQPTLTEVETRLDRIDGRLDALQSAIPQSGAIAAASDAAAAAQAAASQAMLMGILVGGLGVLVGVVAIVLARRPRGAAGTA